MKRKLKICDFAYYFISSKSSVHKIGIASELSAFLTMTCPFTAYLLYL